MAQGMNVDALGAGQREQVARIDAGRLQQLLAQGPAELGHLPVQRPPRRGKDRAHQRVPVGVKSR